MTELRKAAEMALETLENSRVFVTSREKTKHPEGTEWYDDCIEALRQALAEPERDWASLTGYQRLKFADRFHISGEAIEAIEQALKEKNGG